MLINQHAPQIAQHLINGLSTLGIGQIIYGSPRKRIDERRQHILDIAAVTINELGYDTVTTNLIAEKSGVPIGSLYRYFSDKQDILRCLAEQYRDEAAVWLRKRLLRRSVIQSTDGQVAATLVRLMIEYYRHYPVGGMILVAEIHLDFATLGKNLRSEFITVIDELISTRSSMSDANSRRQPHLAALKSTLTRKSGEDKILCKND
jgi:AcrR family transcriptional regulator